ncbi:MAG: hypothetical protein R2713_16825 [Ilumatobacteraceae bacterium]
MPRAVVAGLLVITGRIVAGVVVTAVGRAMLRATGRQSKGALRTVEVTIIALVALVAAGQLGIDTTILNILVAAIAFGGALALAPADRHGWPRGVRRDRRRSSDRSLRRRRRLGGRRRAPRQDQRCSRPSWCSTRRRVRWRCATACCTPGRSPSSARPDRYARLISSHRSNRERR